MSDIDRVNVLETEVREVETQQQSFKPVEPLLNSLDSLLRFETVAASLKKKTIELAGKTEAARQAVTAVKVKVIEQLGSADSRISEGVKKREKDLKSLESRTNAVETAFNSLKSETPKTAKMIEENSRKESQEISRNFDAFYSKECGKIAESIQNSKENAKKVIGETRENALKAINECRTFDEANSEKLRILSSNPPEKTQSLEEIKSEFLAEITGKLQEKVREVSLEFDKKLDEWPKKAYFSLYELVEETEKLYSRYNPPADIGGMTGTPEEMLKQWNKNMRSLMHHLSAYARTNFRSFEVASLGRLTNALAEIKRLGGLTEAGIKVLEAVKEEIPPIEEGLDRIERNLNEDMGKLEESFTLSTGVAEKVGDKKSPVVQLHLNIHRQYTLTKEYIQTQVKTLKSPLQAAKQEYEDYVSEQNEDMGLSGGEED